MPLNHIFEVEKTLFSNHSDWMATQECTQHEINVVNIPTTEMSKIYDALDFCSENKSYQTVEIINHTLEDIFLLEENTTAGIFLIYHPKDSSGTYKQLLKFATKKLIAKKRINVISIFESSDNHKRAGNWSINLDQKKTLLANESDYLDYSIIFMCMLFNSRATNSIEPIGNNVNNINTLNTINYPPQAPRAQSPSATPSLENLLHAQNLHPPESGRARLDPSLA